MISNRTECFDLLFGLLNLGLPDITEAAWTLLTQVPVNQILLNKRIGKIPMKIQIYRFKLKDNKNKGFRKQQQIFPFWKDREI